MDSDRLSGDHARPPTLLAGALAMVSSQVALFIVIKALPATGVAVDGAAVAVTGAVEVGWFSSEGVACGVTVGRLQPAMDRISIKGRKNDRGFLTGFVLSDHFRSIRIIPMISSKAG
jgi:hypothetical protein